MQRDTAGFLHRPSAVSLRRALAEAQLPGKLPDKFADPDGYEHAQAERMRAARLRQEEYDRRWRRKWDEEQAKPIGQRQWFPFASVADKLARDPETLAIDSELRSRIVHDLVARTQNREFATGEVARLGGARPRFRPAEVKPGWILVPDAEALCLSREACRRYVEAHAGLPGAATLPRDWFPESAEHWVPGVKPRGVQSKGAAFKAWADKRYPEGIPPGTTAKQLAREFRDDTGVEVQERTVRRALGGK